MEENPVVKPVRKRPPSREPFVFSLQENWVIQWHNRLLMYGEKTTPERLMPVFFIGISRQRIVVGPFKVTGNMFYDETPMGISRLNEVDPSFGIFQAVKVTCPWRIPFDADGWDMNKTVMGLKWDYIVKEFKVNHDIWRNLIRLRMPIEKIESLASILRGLNSKE